jgi:magnesium-transporting ATPase (P-type)
VKLFQQKGLRTIVFAMKKLKSDLSKAELKEMPISDIESNLTLLGATAVEDTL